MEISEEEKILITASILHDIGKIRVRYNNSKKHPEHGYDMVQEILNSYPNQGFIKEVSSLVKYHHTDKNKTGLDQREQEMLEILQDSDRKSAAHEREDRDRAVQNYGPKLNKLSSYLSLQSKIPKREKANFPILTESGIIDDPINCGNSTSMNYQNLDKNLVDEISKLESSNFNNFLNTLNSILREYTAYVPSAYYYSNPDIPLYDHLKVTAAIAMCQYRSKMNGNSKFILIKTDMSGIQNYIFRYFRSEQADEKGTRRIRGRSLRVSLTTRAIVQYILDELNLLDINVMWLNSDGALIIAPYSEENENKLTNIKENIDRYFMEHDRGIWCAIGWDKAEYDVIPSVKNERNEGENGLDVEDNDFRYFLNGLVDKVNKIKRSPFKEIIKSNGDKFFIQNSTDPCWSCGLNGKNKGDKCQECETEEILGQKIVKSKGKLKLLNSAKGDLVFNFGSSKYSFVIDDGYINVEEGEVLREIYLNNLIKGNKKDILWERFLIGNFTPRQGKNNNGNIISIEEMVKPKASEEKKGDSENKEKGERENFYLGIYKADLDNMGTLISEGFPKLTMPAYAAFSRQTTTFFTQGINKIAEKNEVYLIYSGGDDVSAIGSILNIIEFAKDLKDNFAKWVENDEITISAGIATTHAKFPLRRGIDLAEDSLEISKASGKDSITVFSTTMKNSEFTEMFSFGEKLWNETKGKNKSISSGFLQLLLKLDENNPYKKNLSRKNELVLPDYYLYYYLQRNWGGNQITKNSFLRELVEKKTFEFIRFPATWTIMKIRWEELLKKLNKEKDTSNLSSHNEKIIGGKENGKQQN